MSYYVAHEDNDLRGMLASFERQAQFLPYDVKDGMQFITAIDEEQRKLMDHMFAIQSSLLSDNVQEQLKSELESELADVRLNIEKLSTQKLSWAETMLARLDKSIDECKELELMAAEAQKANQEELNGPKGHSLERKVPWRVDDMPPIEPRHPPNPKWTAQEEELLWAMKGPGGTGEHLSAEEVANIISALGVAERSANSIRRKLDTLKERSRQQG